MSHTCGLPVKLAENREKKKKKEINLHYYASWQFKKKKPVSEDYEL